MNVNIPNSLTEFLNTSLDDHFAGNLDEEALQMRLALFTQTASTVPAYASFLRELGIDPKSVITADDFRTLPTITKQNYISRFPLTDLCRNGRIESCDTVALSSGSTGDASFWPRSLGDEGHTAWRFEQVFVDSFCANQKATLAVICFSLGTWVGGMFTAACCRHLAAKGYRILVVTPGNNREEIYKVVQKLSPQFEQTILLGYPPFLKDLIDCGRSLVTPIPWQDYNVKLVTAGEVFSEEWRTLVCSDRLGSDDISFGSASLYGTADAGVLGNETPLSICIRRFLAANPQAATSLFGEARMPTLVQYDPRSRYFEVVNNQLLFTGDNGIPLIRYNILDTGGIVGYREMLAFLNDHGFDPLAALKNESVANTREQVNIRELPFVYVFGRSSFAVSYYGANIYPENIAVGLEQDKLKDWTTGKFVLEVIESSDQNSRLSVTVELAPSILPDDALLTIATESIEFHLLRLNSEFKNYTPVEYRRPHISLRLCGDPEYFPNGVKHRYTR